jgi:hypothetical protein
MAIPLYACQAHGGKIIQIDDPAVVRDFASIDTSGGVRYFARLLSTRFKGPVRAGYATLRRLVQRVFIRSTAVVVVTPWDDGQETTQTISRVLDLGHPSLVIFPLSRLATEFQLDIKVTTFDQPVGLGSGEIWIVPQERS